MKNLSHQDTKAQKSEMKSRKYHKYSIFNLQFSIELPMGIKTAVIFVGLCVPFFLGTIWAIVDVAQKDFGTAGKKALWWLIASVPFIGVFIYLIFGFRKGKKSTNNGQFTI